MAKVNLRRASGRTPRVQITYDVVVGGEEQRRELPFVLGVLGDFSGKPDPPRPKLRERKFVEIDRENFDTAMKAMRPRLAFTVENRLTDDGTKLAVDLRFERLEDFEPDQVTRNVEPLRRLAAVRAELSALLASVRRDGQLRGRLGEVVRRAAALRARAPGATSR